MGLREEFEEITADIERYLGWLKGDETAWEWREEWAALSDHYGAPYVEIPPAFITEPSEQKYSVVYETLRLPRDSVGEGEERLTLGRQINERMKQSWDNGVIWANGIGEYLNNLCADIIRPDAGQLESSVQAFRDSMVNLEGVLPVQWTDLDFNSWTGESSDECQGVVDDLHSIVRDQYLTYYAHSFALYGGSCALVSKAQEGLLQSMRDFRKACQDNLERWTWHGSPPIDVGPIDPTVAKLGDITWTIVGKIPGLGDITSAVTDFAGLGEDILGLFGVDVSFEVTPFDAQDADTIHTSMTTMLQDKYLTPMENGMLRLRSEKSQAIKAAQDGIDPWYPPTLAGAANEPWEHEAED